MNLKIWIRSERMNKHRHKQTPFDETSMIERIANFNAECRLECTLNWMNSDLYIYPIYVINIYISLWTNLAYHILLELRLWCLREFISGCIIIMIIWAMSILCMFRNIMIDWEMRLCVVRSLDIHTSICIAWSMEFATDWRWVDMNNNDNHHQFLVHIDSFDQFAWYVCVLY